MLPKYHIALGFFFSFVLFLIFPNIGLIGAGIIFLSSFLIDIDHYIYYIIKERKTSLKKAIHHFLEKRRKLSNMTIERRNEFYSGFCFLHGMEILIILILASTFISESFMFVFIGFALHLFLDLIEEIYKGLRIDKISVIYDWIKYKKLKYLK